MLLGTKKVHCPACNKELNETVMISGNTFGAAFYTDGYVDAPMLYPTSMLAECPFCSVVSWRDDFQGDQEVLDLEQDGKYVGMPSVEEKLLFAALNANHEKEIWLRQEIWHDLNHPRRNDDEIIPYTEVETANMQRLLELFANKADGNQEIYLMMAELNRNLGDAAACEAMLDKVVDERLAYSKKRIGKLKQESVYVEDL